MGLYNYTCPPYYIQVISVFTTTRRCWKFRYAFPGRQNAPRFLLVMRNRMLVHSWQWLSFVWPKQSIKTQTTEASSVPALQTITVWATDIFRLFPTKMFDNPFTVVMANRYPNVTKALSIPQTAATATITIFCKHGMSKPWIMSTILMDSILRFASELFQAVRAELCTDDY